MSMPARWHISAIVGKRVADVIRIEMRQRQEHRTAGRLRLADDAAGDDVARREIAVGMVALHERFRRGR